MLKGEYIICISPTAWSDIWRNRQQVMSRLAIDNKIVFIQPKRMNSAKYVPNNITLLNAPSIIPYGANILPKILCHYIVPAVIWLNSCIMAIYIKRFLKKNGIKYPILWLYDPINVGLLGKIRTKLTCWHIHDEVSEFTFNRKIKDMIVSCEQHLAECVDIIFASSNSQYEKRIKYGEKVHLTPNACDFVHFNAIYTNRLPAPDDIKEIPHPILGYYGGIDFRIDVELLMSIANSHNEWSILLIGPDSLTRYSKGSSFGNTKNIYNIGPRDYKLLPAYIKELDVAIFPYLLDSMEFAIPLKLYECLAAGKPVVSTPLPELASFKEIIWLGNSIDSFVDGVNKALSNKNSKDRIEKGIKIARENTWDKRVEQMSAIIEGILNSNSMRNN